MNLDIADTSTESARNSRHVADRGALERGVMRHVRRVPSLALTHVKNEEAEEKKEM